MPAIAYARLLRPSKYPLNELMPVSSARNIGVVFDQEMTLVEHVTTICKTCFLVFLGI